MDDKEFNQRFLRAWLAINRIRWINLDKDERDRISGALHI